MLSTGRRGQSRDSPFLQDSKNPIRSQDRLGGALRNNDDLTDRLMAGPSSESREKRARRLAHLSGCQDNRRFNGIKPALLSLPKRYEQRRLLCPGSRHSLGVPTMSIDCGQDALVSKWQVKRALGMR